MKKTTIAALLFVPATFLASCTVSSTAYVPSNDYVYSVGYYGYQPYWGNYYSSGWGNVGYWRGYRGVATNRVWLGGGGWRGQGWSSRGWAGRGWGFHRR